MQLWTMQKQSIDFLARKREQRLWQGAKWARCQNAGLCNQKVKRQQKSSLLLEAEAAAAAAFGAAFADDRIARYWFEELAAAAAMGKASRRRRLPFENNKRETAHFF